MYKTGIIGLSWIALKAPDNHLDAYKENDKTQVVSLCDTNGTGDVTDYMTMLPLDIVSVCTPAETHAKIVCDIAPYVRAIWCEKPIATNVKDACEMIATCQGWNTSLFINHQRNYMTPKFRFARGKLHTGTHAFALIEHLFKVPVDVEYVDSDEHIFELDCLHTKDRMLPSVLEFIIKSIERNEVYLDYNALEALKRCTQL